MAIQDKAREFWDRISPRERMLVVLLGIAAPITLVLWLGFSIHDGLEAIGNRNDKTRHALEVLADLQARGASVAAPVDDVVSTMGSEPVKLGPYLDKAALKARLVLKSTRPRPIVTRNGFVTTSVSFELEPLGIDELGTFLKEVETQSKVVFVTHLEVTRNRGKPDKVNAQLDVSTYAREKKEGDSAGSGSGAGAGSSTASPGSVSGDGKGG